MLATAVAAAIGWADVWGGARLSRGRWLLAAAPFVIVLTACVVWRLTVPI
jgi:hypothetical protein